MQFSRKIKPNDCGELSSEVLLFLKPDDAKSLVIGNTFSNQKVSWIACGKKFIFVNNLDNHAWVKVDLSDYLSEPCLITCGEELILPGISSSILLLGCETNLGGLLLFFHPFLRRMIRILEIDVGVSTVCLVDPGNKDNLLLPEVMSCMNGIVAVGGVDGSLILVDLHYDVIARAVKGEVDWKNSNWAWPSSVNKTEYICRQTDTWESVQHKINTCLETRDSLAFLLNDSDGELIAPKYGQLYSCITCLHYSPIVTALFVGYEIGVWQMWSLPEMKLMYSSKHETGQGVSVVGLSLMEPCDDPRHYLYLWVGHSQPQRPAFIRRNHGLLAGSPPNSPLPNLYPPQLPACQEPPFSVIYSLSFNKKSVYSSYGLLYSDFEKCDDIFEMEMINELDNFISGRILSVNALICVNPSQKFVYSKDEEKEMLRVWSIVWECEFKDTERMVYLTLFDLNQWYNKTPGRPAITRPPSEFLPIPDTPYYATWYLPPYSQQDVTLALKVDPGSMSATRFFNQLDVHYYPSNISFRCTNVGTMRICQGDGPSVLNEIESKMELQPAAAISAPEPMMHACISVGLLPNFDDTSSIYSITINADMARKFLLTICIENDMSKVVLACASRWFDSACTDTTISLDFIADFLWDLFATYRRRIDELCVCLFDCSGNELNFLDNIRITQLNKYMKKIEFIYNILVKDYSTFKKMHEVKHRHLAIKIKNLYVNLTIWFITHEFLPEQSVNLLPPTSLPYNYELLQTNIAARRVRSHLLIDEMIKRYVRHEDGEWDTYPPPSLQSIIRLALRADIELSVKHFFILYFLQDLLECLCKENYSVNVEEIIQNYEAYFGVREAHTRIAISYRDIDKKKFKEGIETLLHHSVNNSYLEEWEHRHIIMTLHKHNEHALAFRYIKGMKPSLGTTDDVKMEISLNVALGNVSSAFFITQQRNDSRSVLLKHFFQECVKFEQMGRVYRLPLNKFEENSFLEFLRSSDLNVANDLILYFYVDRHRYGEAFVHYDRMKISGEVIKGDQDINSRKRDMIMKNLESRFHPNVLLSLKSICEAKNTQPPPGFYEEKWKPTSSYLKFDDTDPKRPLLKSSIKELAYITVWQGQKLMKMGEKTNLPLDQRKDTGRDEITPLVESVQVTDRNVNVFSKKRQRPDSESVGIVKKVKLDHLSKFNDVVTNELSTPTKQTLNYSIVQELVSTPIVKQIKTPHGQTHTPGPPSILRVRSGKKDDVNSCDESSSTPRKTLKFTLPADTDNKEAASALDVSKPLRFEEISEDESSVESLSDESAQVEETPGLPASHIHIVCDDADEERISNEEELLPDDENDSEVDSINGDEKSAQIDPVSSTLDDHSENVVSLEDRLQQFKSCNRKLNSFINEISLCKSNAERSQDLAFSGDVECSFISSQSSDDNESRTNDLNLEAVSENQEPLTHIENEWHIDNTNVHSMSKSHLELVDDDSSTSDSMDKVYTTIGAPVQKLSTIFETECENEEPCIINTDHNISEVVGGEQKDNYGVMDRANYQESELGDEKLDQECDYMQFSHEENFPKHFDSESENNNDDVEDDIDLPAVITPADKGETAIEKHRTSDDSDDVICIASDSDEDAQPSSNREIGSKDYKESAAEDSLSRSSYSRSEGYSEEEDYDDEYDEDSYEDDNVDEEEAYEEEDLEEEEEEYDGKPVSNADLHGDAEQNYYQEEECSRSEIELSESTVEMENDSCSDGLPETNDQNIPEPSPQPDPSPVKDPLPSSSVTPVDPSFMEKIVSFIRTVSDDQFKNIVDVVKTQIDTSKSPLVTDSENKNTVIEAGAVSSGLLVTDENKKATDESFEDSSCDAARKPELLTSSSSPEPVHQPFEKESTLILDLPSTKSDDISKPNEENIANVDLLESKPNSEIVDVASDSSQLYDLKPSSETVNEAVTQDPKCHDIASNIDECSSSPFNETQSHLINSSQENSDSVVIEQSSETEINVLDSEEEQCVSDTESSLKTESDASSISHRGSNEENILKAVELCPVRKNSDKSTYAFSVNCNDQLPISSDDQLHLRQTDVEMNLDKFDKEVSGATPSFDEKIDDKKSEVISVNEVVELMDDSDGIDLVSKAPAADLENASVTDIKVEVATNDNIASPTDVEMSVCFSNSDKIPEGYECKLKSENSIVASNTELRSDDKLANLTSKPGVIFESDEIHLEVKTEAPEPVESTSERIELPKKVESESEGILVEPKTELPKKVESTSEGMAVEEKEELPKKVESESEGILVEPKTELLKKVESESEGILVEPKTELLKKVESTIEGMAVEEKEELLEKVDSESEEILLEHKTEFPDKVESDLIEKSASAKKVQEVTEGLSSDINDVSKLNAVQKDCTISNASNEHMITVIAGNKTFNKSAFAESSSAVHKPLKVDTVVPSGDKVFRDADDNNDNSTDNSIASLDTAICHNDSTLFTSDVDDLKSPDLNNAMFIDDDSIVDVNTPHSKKNKTQPLLIPEVSTTDDWREYLDSNVTVVSDVSKSVKKKTSSLKRVKMVDKCVMTDKRLLWKLTKICNTKDVKTKKENILTSRNECIDTLNVGTEVESLSKSTLENKPESSKPSRFIRKAVRRVTKSGDSEDFCGIKEELETNENKSSGIRRSVSDKSEIGSVDVEAETNEVVDHDSKKPGRVIRKVLRRKSSAPFKENTSAEGKISINDDNSSNSNYSKLSHHSRSSSVPNITNLDDNHSLMREENKNVYNPGTSKYASHEELNTLLTSTEGTPRRSKRLSRSNNSLNTEELDFEEFDHNNSSARRTMRRSKICRRSTLADIVELPESDLERSSNSSGIFDRHAMRIDKRFTAGDRESKFKTDFARLSHSTRRRTLSSSSEPPMSGFESDHHSDINQHWLRSSSRSDISESTVESHSSHPNIRKVAGEDVLKMLSGHRSHHSTRNRKSGSERNYTSDANSYDFSIEHPPSSYGRLSPDGGSDVQSKNQAVIESSSSRGESKTKDTSAEHIQPVRGRRRTISSSSEPPPIIKHSPVKSTDSKHESAVNQNKRKSLSEVKKRLSGAEVLNFGRVRRHSRSLHEDNKILPATSSNKNHYGHRDVGDISSLPSTSHSESPQAIVESSKTVIESNTKNLQVEHIQPVRQRRRTISSSSEPPPVIQHSPVKTSDSKHESAVNQNKKKSLSDVNKRLTGADILNLGRVGRRSKSLHEGNKILPATSSSKNHYDHQDVGDINSLPSTSHSEPSQLAALIQEYSENRRLTRHQRSLIERSLENTPNTPEQSTPTTPKRRRRSSVVAGSEDEATTPVRYSKRLQDKICKAFP